MADELLLRVGLVGCGYQGGILARNITQSSALRLVACADPDPVAAARVAAGQAAAGQVAACASVEELLGEAPVD